MSREDLHAALKALAEEIDDEANVPERYQMSAKGELADMDSDVLRLAASVVHRLMLWERHPSVSPQAYFVEPVEGQAYDGLALLNADRTDSAV